MKTKLIKSKAKINIRPDLIFECRKCGHNLYVNKSRVSKVLKVECESCGEEPFTNWILVGEGDFNKLSK